MIGALLSFSAMAVSIRTLAGTFNIFEILTIRSAGAMAILLSLAVLSPTRVRELAPRRMALHAIRNVVHFVAQYAWTLSLTLLPLATVFALEFTMPLWVALLAPLALDERMTLARAGSIALGFLGVLIILRPGLGSFHPAALLVLAAAAGFAVSLIATKKLTVDVSTFAIVFWMNVIQLPLALIGSDWSSFLGLQARQIPAAIALAVAGLSAHYCLSNAFRRGDAVFVIPFDFLRIPLIALVGWMFYGEDLDAFVFVGAAVIVAGVVWTLLAESRPAAALAAATEPGS
jgi:drug/metabolite transporter (DMT)-like permease